MEQDEIDSLLSMIVKEQYIYKILKIKLNNKQMSDIMYAIINNGVAITHVFSVGVKGLSRKQNSRHAARIRLKIPKNNYIKFTNMIGIEYEKTGVLHTN